MGLDVGVGVVKFQANAYQSAILAPGIESSRRLHGIADCSCFLL